MQFDLVSLCLRKRLEEHLNELFEVVGSEREPSERVCPFSRAFLLGFALSVCVCDTREKNNNFLSSARFKI